jgi:hypothetical protein
LQWATYFDAADQAGLSRLWGGIHVSVDDLTGRVIGSQCGKDTWSLAQKYFDGSIANIPIVVAMRPLNAGFELRFNTVRGFKYALQATPNLGVPFTNLPPGLLEAFDSSMVRTDNVAGATRFYRAVSAP